MTRDDGVMDARIAALERQVAALERRASASPSDAIRAQELRALVGDVLDDADARLARLDDGAAAGWDDGFFIADADGRFRLQLSGQLQVRWVYSAQDDSPGDDHRAGFEVTRTRLGFGGFIGDPSWRYFIWGGWTASGRSILLDAWIEKRFGGGWSVRLGQFKLPVWQEWTVSERFQQFVERSVIDARYTEFYSQGILVKYAHDRARIHLAFSDGLHTENTGWQVPPVPGRGPIPVPASTDYAFTARAELKLEGDWSAYGDFTSFPGDDPMCVTGASVHVQDGEYGTDDDEAMIVQWTADVSLKLGGGNVYAAVIGTHVDEPGARRDEIGLLVQGGIFVTDHWEIAARWSYGDTDGAGNVSDTISVVTIGANCYFRRHALKWSTDVGVGLDPIDATWGTTGRGFRPDSPGRDGQVVVRTQMQLLF